MKRIDAWIEPSQLATVTAALRKAGVAGGTATGVHRLQGHVVATLHYRGVPLAIRSVPEMKLEMVVHDDIVPRVISALLATTKNTDPGDWEVLVVQVDFAIRISSGEISEAAIA